MMIDTRYHVRSEWHGDILINHYTFSSINLPLPVLGREEVRCAKHNGRLCREQEVCTFITSNEYLNSILKPVTTGPITNKFRIHIQSCVLFKSRKIKVVIYFDKINFTINNLCIPVPYKYVTEELLSFLIERVPYSPSNFAKHLINHGSTTITLDYHRCVPIITELSIIIEGEPCFCFIIRTLKYGDSIDELLAKYERLAISICDYIIDNIGKYEDYEDHKNIVERIFRLESFVPPKSSIN